MKSLSDYIEIACRKWDTHFYKSRAFAKKYEFINRGHNKENLILVLAGFQAYFWDSLLSRINVCVQSSSSAFDVCLCVPKGEGNAAVILRRIAEMYGWSYLLLEDDLLAQAQNTAIKLHPSAQLIFKLDEDMVLPIHYFDDMLKAYHKAEESSVCTVGFVAPLINVNANGVESFLRSTDSLIDYEKQFGAFHIRRDGDDIIHTSPEFALWIWERSIPFDFVSEIIREKNQGELLVAPIRFSIGAFLFSRDFWRNIGFFKVGLVGELGIEEEQVCNYCMNHMRSIIVAKDVFVGHFGFFTQKEICRSFFETKFVY